MARRKQLKKAQYQEFSNCLHAEPAMAGKWQEYFQNDHPITVELGCGHGTFSYAMAQMYPARNFVGIDLKAARMWRSGKKALEEGISNVAFLCQHLLQIENSLAPGEADELWITFPDPFPKKRQAKHRTINRPFLEAYRRILRPGGKLRYKTDNLELFHFSLEVFAEIPWVDFEQISFDLHQAEGLPPEALILTEYEKQFLEMGKTINYACLTFRPLAP